MRFGPALPVWRLRPLVWRMLSGTTLMACILIGCGSAPPLGTSCRDLGNIAPVPLRVNWSASGKVPANGQPVMLSRGDIAEAIISGSGQCTGAMQFDYWITRSFEPSGTGSSHQKASGLIWDWADTNPGQSAALNLSSTTTLMWSQSDNRGRPVAPGRYYAYMTFTAPPTGMSEAAGAFFVVE
jgi:hypothetical protein